jgi:hypothetical protein
MNPKSKFFGMPYDERQKTLKSLFDKAEVEPFGYHDIRHPVAKYSNDIQKVGLKKVQQVLRRRRQATTEIYVEGNYTDTKEAIQLLEVQNSEDGAYFLCTSMHDPIRFNFNQNFWLPEC